MTHDIFISHASVDKEIADAMTDALEAQGIQCWIAPRDIRPGDTWGGSIVRAIESSKMMIIIFSKSSNASRQVLREVERAVQKDVVLLPFRIDDVPPSGDMEYFLSATHWLDALSTNLDTHLQELITISKSILKKPASTDLSDLVEPDIKIDKAELNNVIDNAVPKVQHPMSSAIPRDSKGIELPENEVDKDAKQAASSKVVQTSPVKELKLEARRTPPGTKAKHSKPAISKETKQEDASLKAPLANAAQTRSKEKTNSSTHWIILLGLVSFAAIGWFISQQTNLLQNSESNLPSSEELPLKEEPSTTPETTQSISSLADSKPVKPEVNTSSSNDDNLPLSNAGDQAADETSSEPIDTGKELDKDSSAKDVSQEKGPSLESQDNSDDQPLNSDQDDNLNESNKSTPTETVLVAEPQLKIDEIPALVDRANAGDLEAVMELSDRFFTGKGVERNELESVRLLEIVASNGSADAQNKLASYYANGTIVPRNDEQALAWYTLAAEQGDVNSQYSLGEIYEFGFGAEANLAEAKKWYSLAAEQGHMKAGLFLKNFQQQSDELDPALSPVQSPQINQDTLPEVNLTPVPES